MIEQRLQQLSSFAVYALDAHARNCEAVYFRDEAEPYICLAVKLAQQDGADAWFWPLAARGWHPSMPREEALRALLFQVIQTSAGITAAVAMMKELNERKVLASLLSTLRWQDGSDLLRACSWSRPDVPTSLLTPFSSPEAEAIMQSKWAEVLRKWIDVWSEDDPRTTWLATMALVSEKPARLIDARLTHRAHRLVRLIVASKDLPRVVTGNAARENENLFHGASKPRAKNDDVGDSEKTHVYDGEEHSRHDFKNEVRVSQIKSVSPVDGSPSELTPNETSNWIAAPVTEVLNEPLSRTVGDDLDTVRVEERAQPCAEHPAPQIKWSGITEATGNAGLFFLVPVMLRLGMVSFLETNTHLIEIDFPIRLLRFVGERLGISEDDAVMRVFDEANNVSLLPCDFVAPAVWRQGICKDDYFVVRRIKNAPGGRVLLDCSGRLAIAMWYNRLPEPISGFIKGLPVRRGSLISSWQGHTILLDSWLVAIRRWLRRYARIGLAGLVCRPGRICSTRTHVDILFDHRAADVRIRKAGLDLNPGWVPWIGRVISFHYLYGEDEYGTE